MAEAKESETEVLISGAGPTGLMLALLLAHKGVKFRIFDLSATRAKESRALGLWPKSMELFDTLGIVDKFLASGRKVSGVSAYLKGRNMANISFADLGRDDTPYSFLFILAQSASEEIFEKALKEAGVEVERETTLESFNVENPLINAQLKHADGRIESVTSRFLVGCDGARSQVRKFLNLSFKGGTYDAEFELADAHVKWDLPQDRVQLFLNDKGLGMFFPMKGGEVSRVITLNQNKRGLEDVKEHITTQEPLTLDEIEANFRKAVGHDLKIENPEWLTRYRVHHRSVERMQVGPVFLAGDAAHIHSPAGGQGMNTGLQDAGNLAWKLSAVLKGEASGDLLDTYNSERWPVGQKILHFSDRIFSVAISFGPALSAFRDFAFLLMAKAILSRDFGKRILFGFASQLNIHYHPNSAVTNSLNKQRNGRAIAGRRAPDAPLNNGKTLFDLMRGYKFTLFVMSKMPVAKPEQTQFENHWRAMKRLGSEADIHWIDEEMSPLAIQRYEVDDLLISLIRPDGYIGFQSDHLNI
jgi:2-polyprenyl-6-methoxyphenol hydroxylase-like FAD-dependent oxidoreductase